MLGNGIFWKGEGSEVNIEVVLLILKFITKFSIFKCKMFLINKNNFEFIDKSRRENVSRNIFLK